MKRFLFLILLLASPVQAGPKHWIQHHKRFLLATGAAVGASVIQYKATTYCSRGDVERCVEGYGSRRAFNYFSMGMDVAMVGAAEACWRDSSGKVCYGLAYWTPTTQVALGIHDFTHYRPEAGQTPSQ